MFIYVITNSVTGRVYIGQHKGNSLKKYLQTKLSDASKHRGGSSHLFASMRKHPKEVWSIEPLMEVETKEELNRIERLLIALYDTRNHEVGYNICKGGEGHTGPMNLSPEARAELSERAKRTKPYLKAALVLRGVPRPADVRAQISKSNTGKTHSLETKGKLREARLQQPDPRLGKTHSEKTKKRISDVKKGTPSAFRGKRHTDEAKSKNRQAHIINIQGQQFGNVVPVSIVGTAANSSANWLVRCMVCGTEGVVRGDRVRNGQSHFMKVHHSCKN
jgi:group I intron endonuclease